MKTVCKTILLLVLSLALVVTLFACAGQGDEDESWMIGEVDLDSNSHYAKSATPAEDDNVPSSGQKIDLPTIPLN